MRSTFMGLEIGKRGIVTQRYGLDVTGQNVTNASTPGYSRQSPTMVATTPLWVPGLAPAGTAAQLGTGVTTAAVTRAENELLARQTRTNLSAQGRLDQYVATYAQIENIFVQPNEGGLDVLVTNFFESWQALSLAPEEDANRQEVQEAALALSEEFQRIDATLKEYRELLNDEVESTVRQVNVLLEQIAQLNNEIARVVGLGHSPNDLLDARDVALEELSALVPIQVQESENRQTIVTVLGRVVVQDNEVRPLECVVNWDNNGYVDVVYSDRPEIELEADTGSLGALVFSRDRLVPAFMDELDAFAASLISEVNDVHSRTVDGMQLGYGLDGLTGRDFFQGADAATIDLAEEVKASTRAIQAANDRVAGDGDNAVAIAQLQWSRPLGGGTLTFDGFYQALMADLGAASEHVQLSQATQEKLLEQMANLREQERGVNLDEEFVALIRYEQGYSAAARFITTVDEGLDKLINGTGRVGL